MHILFRRIDIVWNSLFVLLRSPQRNELTRRLCSLLCESCLVYAPLYLLCASHNHGSRRRIILEKQKVKQEIYSNFTVNVLLSKRNVEVQQNKRYIYICILGRLLMGATHWIFNKNVLHIFQNNILVRKLISNVIVAIEVALGLCKYSNRCYRWRK